MADGIDEGEIARRLAALFEQEFGGKPRGRYRISMKHLKALAGRRRVPAESVRRIAEEMYELGYVLIDLETFFVVLAQRTFGSYRRVSDGRIGALSTGASQAVSNGSGAGTDD